MNCLPCKRNNNINIADKYCVECQEYFCKTCVRMHENFSILAQHTLLEITDGTETGREESQKLTGSTVLQVPTERCLKHPAKSIDMYCRTHDIVGCSVCFTPHYKGCDDIHYVPDIAQELFSTDALQKSVSELTASKEKLEQLMEACLTATNQLAKMKTACLDKLKAFRNEINEIVDELESKTTKEIEQKYNHLDRKLCNDKRSIDAVVHKMEKQLARLKVTDSNKSTLFVSEKLCKNLASAADDLHRCVGKPSKKTKLFFKGDSSIQTYLNRLSSLGYVRDQKIAFSSIKEKTTHDIKVDDDADTCNIWGTCITGDDNILIADNTNNKLKLLDKQTYEVKSFCSLSASPRSLCRVSEWEAAVSLSNRVIQFVETKDTLTLTRTLQMEHNCFGLALTKGNIYISDGSQNVYVYDMDGKLQRTIFQDNNGETIFSESRDITVSDDSAKIHVADSRKGLITLSIEGNVLWQYTGSELKGAYGVCTDGDGNLLITGILSHNVMLMSQTGEKIGPIINASDGIQSPVSVCFDQRKSRVLVTKNGNHLIAFEFD
ncbi:uncharacterized protein LOC123551513 [Mercenaria mercenaria]|uniref:uncharacterized protein LOC123551513 n=1 Tax=Mercenaria mercenaria TaxID=6596 RepID=UPI00234E3A6A|nr:uncharacterized protein LOC123551513 [Mercenaria mercenaria]